MVLRGEGRGDQSLLSEYKGGEHKKVTAIKGDHDNNTKP